MKQGIEQVPPSLTGGLHIGFDSDVLNTPGSEQ